MIDYTVVFMVVAFLLIAWLAITMAAVFSRNTKFNKHLAECRRQQLVALEHMHNGDRPRADLHMAAAQDALERAKEYL